MCWPAWHCPRGAITMATLQTGNGQHTGLQIVPKNHNRLCVGKTCRYCLQSKAGPIPSQQAMHGRCEVTGTSLILVLGQTDFYQRPLGREPGRQGRWGGREGGGEGRREGEKDGRGRERGRDRGREGRMEGVRAGGVSEGEAG